MRPSRTRGRGCAPGPSPSSSWAGRGPGTHTSWLSQRRGRGLLRRRCGDVPPSLRPRTAKLESDGGDRGDEKRGLQAYCCGSAVSARCYRHGGARTRDTGATPGTCSSCSEALRGQFCRPGSRNRQLATLQRERGLDRHRGRGTGSRMFALSGAAVTGRPMAAGVRVQRCRAQTQVRARSPALRGPGRLTCARSGSRDGCGRGAACSFS